MGGSVLVVDSLLVVTPIVFFVLLRITVCPFYICNHLVDGEKRAGYFVFLVSSGCCVVLPRGAMGLYAVCDCGIS